MRADVCQQPRSDQNANTDDQGLVGALGEYLTVGTFRRARLEVVSGKPAYVLEVHIW